MAPDEFPSISVSRPGSRTAGSVAECAVVRLRGEHDATTRHAVADAILGAAGRDDANVVVDLSGVTFMDAATVGAILEARGRLHARRKTLELRAPSAAALRILRPCGLDHLVAADVVPGGAGAALAMSAET